VYRRILGPVCYSEKENWIVLTIKEMYAVVKKIHHNKDNKVCVGLGMYRNWKEIELCWFRDVQRMEENRIVLV
jgi:hypothetical protein